MLGTINQEIARRQRDLIKDIVDRLVRKAGHGW